jgi:hypothetical protein
MGLDRWGRMRESGIAMVNELQPIWFAFARFQWKEFELMGDTHQDDENELE